MLPYVGILAITIQMNVVAVDTRIVYFKVRRTHICGSLYKYALLAPCSFSSLRVVYSFRETLSDGEGGPF